MAESYQGPSSSFADFNYGAGVLRISGEWWPTRELLLDSWGAGEVAQVGYAPGRAARTRDTIARLLLRFPRRETGHAARNAAS